MDEEEGELLCLKLLLLHPLQLQGGVGDAGKEIEGGTRAPSYDPPPPAAGGMGNRLEIHLVNAYYPVIGFRI